VALPILRRGRFEGVKSVIRDITARKQAEEALHASEQRYRKLFEANLAGMYLTRPDGTIIDFNEAMMRMLGYDSREELLHQKSSDLYADPELRKELVRLLRQDGIVPAREAVLLRKDGSFLHALGHAVLLADQQTGEPYIQGMAIDISERKRAEEALRELTHTLESKVAERTAELQRRARQLQKLTLQISETEERERRRMAEILHDDLQQELAAAKFHVSLMKERARHDASLQATAAQVEHLLRNAIGKSRSLSHELSPAALHHGDFAEALRWLAHEMQARHGLRVHLHAAGHLQAPSEATKALLYRATQELLFNVVKHADVQEARVRVRQCGRCICLAVSDRGGGFDVPALGESAGFGLLSIRERVEMLGGRMKIRSRRDHGSTFSIAVPNRPTMVPGTPEPPGLAPEAEGVPGAGPPRLQVLIADDHEIVREGLLALLRDEHTIEVVGEATNGREAVDLTDRLEPDVVIMDVSMPLLSGEEATRQIKQHRPNTRVVALSMFEDAQTQARMRAAGAEAYVVKTAPSEALLAALHDR